MSSSIAVCYAVSGDLVNRVVDRNTFCGRGIHNPLLGRVWQSPLGGVSQPDPDAGDGDGAPVHVVAFLVAGRGGAAVAEFVDRPLDGVAVAVTLAVPAGRAATSEALLPPGLGLVVLDRDRGLDPAPGEVVPVGFRRVRLVGQHPVRPRPGPAGTDPCDADQTEHGLECDRVVPLPLAGENRDRPAAL